jgi:hypothetical protein
MSGTEFRDWMAKDATSELSPTAADTRQYSVRNVALFCSDISRQRSKLRKQDQLMEQARLKEKKQMGYRREFRDQLDNAVLALRETH